MYTWLNGLLNEFQLIFGVYNLIKGENTDYIYSCHTGNRQLYVPLNIFIIKNSKKYCNVGTMYNVAQRSM